MDAFLAIASRRETRAYRPDPLPEAVVVRILEAGRISGSAVNRQPWRFVVVETREVLDRLAPTLYAPGNLAVAPLFVAVLLQDARRGAYDGGRASQNMMLAAWNDGVGSCPNGVRDADAAERIAGAPVGIVLTFGYPARARNPEARTPEEWSARAKRKPFDEVVRYR